MIHLICTIEKFTSQGEKTGWSYVKIPAAIALQLKPGNKKAFRVKGKIDEYVFEGISLIPMGGGDFILAINGTIRKAIGKTKGAIVNLQLQEDDKPILPPAELLECLADEPVALKAFYELTKGHQNYFINYLQSAKTEETKAKHIAQIVNALSKNMDFGEMIRSAKKDRNNLLG